MVGARSAALANARRALSDSGEVVVVDFGDLAGLPSSVARRFRGFLRTFHVEPLEEATLAGASSVRFGPGRYYVLARFGKSA
jgi:S-adenosylmethionine-diacylgycerolhomoserine-N-methlytransferase